MEEEHLQKSLSDLHVKVALVEGAILEKVRQEFATKASVEVLAAEQTNMWKTVRKLDKAIYAAMAVFGIVLVTSRMAARYVFG